MDRPKIEEFLKTCSYKTPGPWNYEFKPYPNVGLSEMTKEAIIYSDDDSILRHTEIPSPNREDFEFIAAAGTYAESIAKYAIEQEQKAALMERAFEILRKLDENCPYKDCPDPISNCHQCILRYALSEAERQLKEENHD